MGSSGSTGNAETSGRAGKAGNVGSAAETSAGPSVTAATRPPAGDPTFSTTGRTASTRTDDVPSAACARSPQRNPNANNPPTSTATRSARRPAAVRVTRSTATGRAAGQFKRTDSSGR